MKRFRTPYKLVAPIVREWIITFMNQKRRAGIEYIEFPQQPYLCNETYKKLYFEKMKPEINVLIREAYPGKNYSFNYCQLKKLFKKMISDKELSRINIKNLSDEDYKKNMLITNTNARAYCYRLADEMIISLGTSTKQTDQTTKEIVGCNQTQSPSVETQIKRLFERLKGQNLGKWITLLAIIDKLDDSRDTVNCSGLWTIIPSNKASATNKVIFNNQSTLQILKEFESDYIVNKWYPVYCTEEETKVFYSYSHVGDMLRLARDLSIAENIKAKEVLDCRSERMSAHRTTLTRCKSDDILDKIKDIATLVQKQKPTDKEVNELMELCFGIKRIETNKAGAPKKKPRNLLPHPTAPAKPQSISIKDIFKKKTKTPTQPKPKKQALVQPKPIPKSAIATKKEFTLTDLVIMHDSFSAKLDEKLVELFLEAKAESDAEFLKLISNLYKDNAELKEIVNLSRKTNMAKKLNHEIKSLKSEIIKLNEENRQLRRKK